MFIPIHRAEIVVARFVELVGGEGGAGRENTGDFSPYQFPGFGDLGLIAKSDLAARGEELGHIRVGGVVGDPRHGIILPLRQRESAYLGGIFGILIEELVEISESKK
jgi:hypothetical protein